jgi:hypothetical protein
MKALSRETVCLLLGTGCLAAQIGTGDVGFFIAAQVWCAASVVIGALNSRSAP